MNNLMSAEVQRIEKSEEKERCLLSDINLTPSQIVTELDRFVIAQDEAKRAVAIALRNRWRRLQLSSEMQDEITPKNIIMIGPTGVGKTEISRRLAKLARAPFVKVEASKFTEIGYVGRDVESIVRDLVEAAHQMVKEEERERVKKKAEAKVEEKLLDLLLPDALESDSGEASQTNGSPKVSSSTRDKLREMLKEGKLEDRVVEVETQKQVHTHLEVMGPHGMAEIEGQIKEMFQNMVPRPKERKTVKVSEARKLLLGEMQESLIEPEKVATLAVERASQTGIIFIDEIDKICGGDSGKKGPDVSREGVQRDLLPIVEGCTVSTKYGQVSTDHILFIASGAFHFSKPSDLMPEFQGRFPIRVELNSLSAEHFARILTEPEHALTKQYVALMDTEGVTLEFTEDAIAEISRVTVEVNSQTENIGARRLHTLLEKVLEELSFSANELDGQKVVVNKAYVEERVSDIAKDVDLARFIL